MGSASRTAAREEKRRRRLGPDAACELCGKTGLEALQEVTDAKLAQAIQERLLEHHHVAGRAHDRAFTVILCLNCHAEVTESYRRLGVPMRFEANPLDRLIAKRWAIRAFREAESDAEERDAEALAQHREFLEDTYPGWRERFERWRSGDHG